MNSKKSFKSIDLPVDSAEAVTLRKCNRIEEFQSCVRLEREVWQSADIDIVPIPLFVVAAETGGHVLGAYQGDELVGFAMAIAGWRNRRPFLHSHMTAVHSAHRDRGIGRQLKLFQRADALKRGISLVEWTFDPLVARNAYFNLVRLGAIARRFIPNIYGITTSPLHAGLPTDRLVAEWNLRSPRVRRALSGKPSAKVSKQAVRISVPAGMEALKSTDPERARKAQNGIQAQFSHWLAKNYAATSVEKTKSGTDYILEPWKSSSFQ